MKKYLFKTIQTLLVFSLAFTLTNCGNLDNPLEELSGGGSGGSGGGGTVTAATITTAPTATAGDILAGSTTALVTAGVADGGTLMYKATSDNTQPTSTDGFSAEMPTAAALAMGTYFVWYYAKAADAQHTDSEIAATPVEVTVKPGLSTPLTIEAISQGKIVVSLPQSGMKYSTDGGVTKKDISDNPTNIPVAAGDKVAFYGTNTSYSGTQIGGADDGGTFKCKVYGNIMSLLYEDFADRTELPADNTFTNLFQDNDNLTDASGLLLPATTLKNGCYQNMFYDCTNLAAAPKELPATTLADQCYMNMFYCCKALTTAPELKAETLAVGCYESMFRDCTSLTTAPALPATTLKTNCYYRMFRGCTSLKTAHVKADFTTVDSKCSQMFNGCTADGAKLHTTTTSKTSWETVMGPTQSWNKWTVVDDWND